MEARCPRCDQVLPIEAFASYPSRPRDSYCRECRRAYRIERSANPVARRRDNNRAKLRHRERWNSDPKYREARKRWRKITAERQDPADFNERMRFYYWRDAEERPREKAMFPSRTHYRPPSKVDVVPAEPIAAYLRHRFPDCRPSDIAAIVGYAISERRVRDIFAGQEHVGLDTVDRLLTVGFGRPDLLNALYPVDA